MPAIGRIARVRVAEAALRGKRPMPPRRRCDDDDIGLVHHLRLGREVDGERHFAAVRRNIVERCRRLPWLQRERGAGEQVTRATGGDIRSEHMGLATVGEPVVPESVLAALREMSRDFDFLALLPALRLRLIGLQIRPDPRDEGDAPAIGKPAQARCTSRNRRQSARFASIRRDQVHLRLFVVLALRRESDPLAVGRPHRIAVLVATREAPRLAAIGGKKPQLGTALVFFHVVRGDGGARRATIRRDRRRPDALDRPQIFDAQRMSVSRHGRRMSLRARPERPARKSADCTRQTAEALLRCGNILRIP